MAVSTTSLLSSTVTSRFRGASRRGTGRGAPGEPRRIAYLYLAPALLLVTLFVLLPVLHTVYLSFVSWDGVTVGTWVGFANYIEIVADEHLRSLFVHSLQLVFFYAGMPIAFALLVTALLSRRAIRGMTFYRSALFFPQVVSMVVIAVAWQWVYAQSGVLNQFLGFVGLDQGIAWLGSFEWALPAIGIVGAWLSTGLCMVLFLSGVQKIDPALYEAARLDGGNAWHEFLHITLPGLRAEMAVALTLTVTGALKSFDLVYLLTRGGPGTSTSVPGYEIFARAFARGEAGSAASLAVVLTILIVVVAMIITRLSKDPEV